LSISTVYIWYICMYISAVLGLVSFVYIKFFGRNTIICFCIDREYPVLCINISYIEPWSCRRYPTAHAEPCISSICQNQLIHPRGIQRQLQATDLIVHICNPLIFISNGALTSNRNTRLAKICYILHDIYSIYIFFGSHASDTRAPMRRSPRDDV
jgi:hypothetical protein